MWTSRKRMLRVIAALARQPHVISLCRRAGISPQTWQAILTNDAIDADTATGRNMRTSQVVAGARVNRGPKQVQRARGIAVRVGIMVELYRARELTRRERLDLVARHPGHPQRGHCNNYSLTVCTPRQRARISIPRPGRFAQLHPQAQANVHLPPEGGLSLLPHLLRALTLAAAGAAEDAEPPAAARHRRRRRPGTRLAIELMGHPGMQVLLSGVRPGTLVGQLRPFEHGGWRGHALRDALLEQATWAHIPTWEPAHSPFGLLKTLLGRIDPVADVHLGAGLTGNVGELADPPSRPAPCGSSECDGHGWVNGVDEHGYSWARPCPHCAPSVRAVWVDDLDVDELDVDVAGVGEPAF